MNVIISTYGNKNLMYVCNFELDWFSKSNLKFHPSKENILILDWIKLN